MTRGLDLKYFFEIHMVIKLMRTMIFKGCLWQFLDEETSFISFILSNQPLTSSVIKILFLRTLLNVKHVLSHCLKSEHPNVLAPKSQYFSLLFNLLIIATKNCYLPLNYKDLQSLAKRWTHHLFTQTALPSESVSLCVFVSEFLCLSCTHIHTHMRTHAHMYSKASRITADLSEKYIGLLQLERKHKT